MRLSSRLRLRRRAAGRAILAVLFAFAVPATSAAPGVALGAGVAHSAARTAALSEFSVVGSAQLLSDRLRVTPATLHRRGAAWLPAKQPVWAGFDATFSFQISEKSSCCSPTGGGDGFAFVIQNSSATALGGDGYNKGFGRLTDCGHAFAGIADSVAVAFQMGDNDLLSVQTRGTLPNDPSPAYALGSAVAPVNMEDDDIHTATIHYVPRGTWPSPSTGCRP